HLRGVLTVMFFFSSRRRHTRFSRDWSSDVCSSDLGSTTMRWCWYEHSSESGDRPNQTESLKSSRSCARDGRLPGLEGLEPLRAYGYRKPDQFKSALVSDRAGPPGLGYALCAPPLLQSAV